MVYDPNNPLANPPQMGLTPPARRRRPAPGQFDIQPEDGDPPPGVIQPPGSQIYQDDLASKTGSISNSWAGLPAWAQSLLQGQAGGRLAPSLRGLKRSVSAMDNSGRFIDRAVRTQQQQYQRGIAQPLQRQIDSAMGSAGAKGIAGSSVMGDWMGRIAEEANKGALAAQQASSIWGSNAQLDQIGKRVAANQQYASTIANLLGLTQQSGSSAKSWSYNPNLTGFSFAGPG